MNTRAFKAIFFILIFLTSKVGVALNVHYCGGHIAEISLAWKAEGCKRSSIMEQGFALKNSHCCENETVFIQNNTPQKAYDLNFDFSAESVAVVKKDFDTYERAFIQKSIPPKSCYLVPVSIPQLSSRPKASG